MALFQLLVDASGARLIPEYLPTMHVEHQIENMFPPKAEMQYWGHCGIGNILPKIVKLPNIHQRLTRQKMRMDNLSSRRSALVNFERSALFRKSASSRREVIHANLLAREALMNVRKFDNLRKDIAYTAMSPILHLRFWGGTCSPFGAPRALCALEYKACATGVYKRLEKRKERPC